MKPSPLLAPLSLLYGAMVALRNWFFDIGILNTRRVGVPVVSVGNLRAGGSGKTPFVEYLARLLMRRGKRVAILSRGYGRTTRGYVVVSNGRQRCAEARSAGDEPAMLAETLTGAIIVVDENRVRGARTVIDQFHPDAIILDDGFQHRYLARDVDIVIVPADDVLGKSRLLPAGYQREPWSSLRRSDLVVVAKCRDRAHAEVAVSRLQSTVGKPVAAVRTAAALLRNSANGESIPLDSLNGEKIVAFSGIGDPQAFERTVGDLKVNLVEHLKFSDHHWFTESDLARIREVFTRTGAKALITTQKDIVRLGHLKDPFVRFVEEFPLYVVEIEPMVISGEENLRKALGSL